MMKSNKLTSPEVIFFDLGDTLVAGNRQWVSGAHSILQRFSQSYFRVGIISNMEQLNRTEISSLLPIDFNWCLFENALIVLSAEVGVEKPDPTIFELALERGAVPANLCLFCTENLHHTLIAQSLGYKTARIESVQEKDLLTLADFFLDAN